VSAHRWIYEEMYGLLLPGFVVCHDCPGGDQKLCVNYLFHLKPGSIWDNARDAWHKGGYGIGPTHWSKRSPELVLRGERHGRAKLTAEQVLLVRALRGKVPARELALRFGVGDTAILYAQQGRTWRHLKSA